MKKMKHEKTRVKNVLANYSKSNSLICLQFSHLVCYTVQIIAHLFVCRG